MRKIVVILGPTASGKTDLVKKLITKYNGEVISADSRQIFKYMDIGTGKDKSFFQHMIDIREPNEEYSVAEYQKEVYKIIYDIFSRGKTPFLVGGSMLYIDAVLEGFEFPCESRELRDEIEKETTVKIYNKLNKIDPISAEKNKLNRRRLIRALEVYLLNSRSQSEYRKIKPNFEYLLIGIDVPRQELYQRIDDRVDARINEGMIEEVENLLKMGVTHKRLQSFGLEYRYISEYLKTKNEKLKTTTQNLKLNTELEKIKQETIQKLKYKIHAFARRQLTWWRRNKNINWISSQSDGWRKAEKLISKYLIS
ncbi:MAG: tRNA delta(2)-isopentenylpyrophosphate transferase [uncultured bacterium]|nr:MAG: tRNA delta(2)-isopentenylpyrophosphate transferase [uncultured bacterium]